MKQYLQMLINKESLSQEEMKDVATALFREDISDSEMAGFLIALKAKGETPDEITGLVEVLRQHALPFTNQYPGVMDNCGTGGDGSQSFNISTTSAFVIAGAGIKVAKHGNRSVSSKTGSADVLELLGVNLELPVAYSEELLQDIGITFLYAPHVQPRVKRIMKVRRDLKIPTIFNLIGPLTNPVELEYQLLGLYERKYLTLFADVLRRLGRKRAVVVNGEGFMDEASLQGENHVAVLENGQISNLIFTAEEVGLQSASNDAIKGGDAKDNADILLNVLKGKYGPHRDAVLLNAGLGIYAGAKAATVKEGVEIARESIDSGHAYATLQALIEKSQKLEVVG
ncbi:anthranilate phosphoribosyltransferase [Bacillus massiliigorillae]|uniref:anthranilate phosphoribosyltransferase n=1 Tax=Bacillus massiliigorillae TaxID=1243664 RepID=UPI00039F4268|nr:anthranilate phosphoribosyltransferase [Bacillus massiliigorillae]